MGETMAIREVQTESASGWRPWVVSRTAAVVLVSVITVGTMAASADAARVRSPQWVISSSVPGGTYYSITCPTASECYAVGPSGLEVTRDAGASWSSYLLPAGTSALTSIACSASTSCQVVGYETEELGGLMPHSYQVGVALNLSVSPSGPAWTTESLPVPAGDNAAPTYTGVSCASTSDCYVASTGNIAASTPAFFATTDGGTHWSVEALPAGVGEFNSLSCPSSPSGSTCYATDDTSDKFAATTDGGATWTVVAAPKPTYGMNAISCPSTSTCFVAGNGGTSVTTDSGAAWVSQKVPKGSELLGISCSTTTACTAVGIAILKKVGPSEFIASTANGGIRWKHVTAPAGAEAYYLTGVSCYATTSCFAAGPWSPNDGSYLLSAVGS